MPKRKNKRLEAALRIREAAIVTLRSKGKFKDTNIGPMLFWAGDGLEFSYRTPFQKLPTMSGELIQQALGAGVAPEPNLPFGLDIWDRAGGGKVLNIEWNDRGDVCLVSFRRGDWEKKVLAFLDAGQSISAD